MTQAIRSRHVVTPDGVKAATVVFRDGRITAVEQAAQTSGVEDVLDVGDRWLLPGLVDTHIHINDPGRSDWEGFATATRAAAAGGYTCLVDMPLNSVPATINVAALQRKRDAASGNALVDYAFWGGAVPENKADIPALADAGARGFKAFLVHSGIEEFSLVTEADLRMALPAIAESGLPLLVHAELPEPIQAAERNLLAHSGDWRAYATYLASRPDQAELDAINLLIILCREFRCRMHIVHLATASALPALRSARSEGLPITVETCPHYLYFSAERIPAGATQFKCAPPIRGAANRELLWQALRERDIDLVATDHSPCPPALKRLDTGNFREAWGGIASVSLALPVVWTAARERGFGLADVVRWMACEPARLAGVEQVKGSIEPGKDADFCVFDPELEWTVTAENLHFRHPVSPYVGECLCGQVVATYVRGRQVFSDGRFAPEHMGRECPVSQTARKM